MFSPSGVNASCTLLNSQSLAAKPPTRTTCWIRENVTNIAHRYAQGKKLTDIVLWALFLWSNTALTMQFTEGSKNEATSVLNEPRVSNVRCNWFTRNEEKITPWASVGRSECYRSHRYPEWTQIWYTVVLQLFWSVVSSFYQSIERYAQGLRWMVNLAENLDRC